MHIVITIIGILVVFAVLLDAFETVVLPRRVRRQYRLTSWFYRRTWVPWRKITTHIKSPSQRENFLGYFGPLSLLVLLGLWAATLIFGFALLQYGAGEHVQLSNAPITFGGLLYHSGETFFTLGYGDIVPTSPIARLLAVLEAGMGFGFLGTVVGYLPTIYAAFSRREVQISLLDARAGSPPTAAELLGRFGNRPQQFEFDQILRDWERWAGEVLESQISYPPLGFFRSQHSNQSWLGALTVILDASSLVIAGVDNLRSDQAKITFAMARHAVVDLAQVSKSTYDPAHPDRLPAEQLARLRKTLADRSVKLKEGPEFEETLRHLRSLYEPYSQSVARTLLITLPPWIHPEKKKDNWEAGPWDRAIQAKSLVILGQASPPQQKADDHF
ncbi:MAG: potassium channel family protein [Terriglobales bacterium]